jgi:hypothetical protein
MLLRCFGPPCMTQKRRTAPVCRLHPGHPTTTGRSERVRAAPPDGATYRKASAISFTASQSTWSRAEQTPHQRAMKRYEQPIRSRHAKACLAAKACLSFGHVTREHRNQWRDHGQIRSNEPRGRRHQPAGKVSTALGVRLHFSEAIMKNRTMARKLERARVQAREFAAIECGCLRRLV